MTLKPFGSKSFWVYVSAVLMSFCAVQAHAQGFPFPMPGGDMQGNQVNCERLAELARRGAAMSGGMDLNAIMAMMGCKPPAGAARPDAGAVKPKPGVGVGATQPPRRTADETCRNLASVLDNSHTPGPGFWLGPMPVVFAKWQAERCVGTSTPSAAGQRLYGGLLRFGEGRFDESADAFREGVSQANSDGMRTRLLAEMGKSRLAAGRAKEARSAFEQALGMAEKGAAPAQDRPRRMKPVPGGNMQELLERAQREGQRERAADAMRQMHTELLILVGLAHLQTDNVAGAIERMREARALVERRGEKAIVEPSIVSPYLALALQRGGRNDEARALLEDALTGREGMLHMVGGMGPKIPEMMSQGLGMIGMRSPLAGREQSIARNMEAAATTSGEHGLPGFACPLLEQIHVQGNAPEQALEVTERCRARALTQLLANRAFHKPLPSIQQMAATQRRPGADSAKELGALSREFLDNPQAEAASRPATIADMRRMAAERGATVVVYSILYTVNRLPNRMPERETGLRIWVVSPDGRIVMRQRSFEGVLNGDTYALTAAVMRARESLGLSGRGLTIAAAPARAPRAITDLRRLHQVLIEPVADLLPVKEGARVLFVPQGALFLLPFAALENTAGAPLIARYAVSVTPSMQTLALTAIRKQMSRAAGSALIVGNPMMPRYSPGPGQPAIDIPDLPGAAEEAKVIGALLKAAPLTGAAATKSAVMQQARTARYIHLATHGFLDDFSERAQGSANPHLRKVAMLGGFDESGSRTTPGMLALAPSGSDSGMLTADEIAESTTNAELVVMSACDTGRGEINDEGVIGLSRAWMAAGAPSAIVSLWAIRDNSTRDLMVDFYRRLAAGGGKAEALREAMLATRAKYPHPVHWAAFVLLGVP